MTFRENWDLKPFNTFGVSAHARYFVELNEEAEISELFSSLEFKKGPVLFMGGGSNILFTHDWEGVIVLNKLRGIEVLREDEDTVLVRAFGGEVWHDLVEFAVVHGYWGIENLSLIPGTVGAAPMQNIGAYGVELKDVLESVEVYDLETGEKKMFTNKDCKFGYRDSIFKSSVKGKYFISAIVIKLSKKENKNISYKVLKEYLEHNQVKDLSLRNISNAVVEIRKSKLPDPKVLGNAGSFFKNVFVNKDKAEELKNIFPDMPSFEEEERIKIPAGWLIEMCGWKGKRVGNVGMHERQALVLVNYGGATGWELKQFAELVVDSVYQKFGLKLTPEVNFV